jgi:phosphoribosylaminoimidazole carboxylase (NCAIR synthetase)
MSHRIKVEMEVAALISRAAESLGLEVHLDYQTTSIPSDEHLAIVAINSARTQLATYPAISVAKFRNRIVVKPTKANQELLMKLQIVVNERAKSSNQSGVATYRFTPNGEFIEVSDVISIDSVWSMEYAYTSVFENAVRSANQLPLGKTEFLTQDFLVMNFDVPRNLGMTEPFLHLYAREPGYRIVKATSHTGYVALQGDGDLFEQVSHAVDYLEGVINE